jgi:phosphate transport system substrate-binding protein
MPNSPHSSSHREVPDRALVIKIDKSAAFLLMAGLFFVSVVVASMLKAPPRESRRSDSLVSDSSTMPSVPAQRLSFAQQGNSDTSAAPTADPASTNEPPVPDALPNPVSEPLRAEVQPQQPLMLSSNLPEPLPPEASSPPPNDSSSADTLSPDAPVNNDAAPSPETDAAPVRSDASTPRTLISGAGTVFPYPLYSRWFEEFQKRHPNVQFSYQSVGSAAGFKQLRERMVDFASTDIPLHERQPGTMGPSILYVPAVIGAVVVAYELPGVPDVRFTPEILSEIFLGHNVRWNDPRIAAANASRTLPDLPIIVIHRSDGCAATYVLSDYLSKVSPPWRTGVGTGTSVNWPIGLGGKGNEGVTGLLRQTPGAVTYTDYFYAVQNHLPSVMVQNHAGRFVKANVASLTAAGSQASYPGDFRVSITDAPGAGAYPISSFTWILAPVLSRNASDAQDLRAFLRWMLMTHAQGEASDLGYGPLPDDLLAKIQTELTRIR